MKCEPTQQLQKKRIIIDKPFGARDAVVVSDGHAKARFQTAGVLLQRLLIQTELRGRNKL